MANQIPLSGLTPDAGGYILPFDQGAILTQGLLVEAGAIALAGDTRSTSTRKEVYSIWKGRPTASFVGESGTKPVTGAEFGAGTMNVKKVASIVLFTDEQLADIANGDLNVLVDSGVRDAIVDTIDNDAIKGSNFDSQLSQTTSSVTMTAAQDGLAVAISAAMGSLEANGYGAGNGALIPPDVARHLRDARSGGTIEGLYQSIDPLYGLERFTSTNLNPISGSGTVGYVVHRPNLHVRMRQDVTVKPSTEATLTGAGAGTRSLYQEDLTALRYVTRLAFAIHDINRAVIKITK